jgi:hypothetical protein
VTDSAQQSSRWLGKVSGAIDPTILRIDHEMRWLVKSTIAFLSLILTANVVPAPAAGIEYPPIIRTRYEAVDQKIGGSFVIFSERENFPAGSGMTP